MTDSRPSTEGPRRIQFRVRAEHARFWAACLAAAAQAGQPLGEWLYDRLKTQPVDGAAQPLPPVTWIQGLEAGRRQGWLMAQLDQAFGPDGPGMLDRDGLLAWMRQYPDDWADLTGWLLRQPWARRFQQWWGPLESPRVPHRRQ